MTSSDGACSNYFSSFLLRFGSLVKRQTSGTVNRSPDLNIYAPYASYRIIDRQVSLRIISIN